MAEMTPMMRQYMEIKEQNKDSILFFRLGDFYEMFGDDARKASRELDLTLTTRDKDKNKSFEEKIPMCGIPYHASDAYIARLIAKGYNFYGDYATANDQFTFFQPGSCIGSAAWIDTYIDKIALNNDLQLALVNLFANAKSLPYNRDGYAQIEAACLDPIVRYLNFGAIRAGVSLSNAQISQVNTEAGVRISDTLSTRGWYLQIKDATAQVRAQRKSPPCKLWRMDGWAIQLIEMSSTTVL